MSSCTIFQQMKYIWSIQFIFSLFLSLFNCREGLIVSPWWARNLLCRILQRSTFFCLSSPRIEGKLTYEMETILVPSVQLRKWCHEEFTQLGKVTSLRDGSAPLGIPTVTLTSTCNTKARCLALAKWGFGEPKNTRSSDTSTFGTTLKNQNRTKSIMGYFRLTLLYVNLTLQLKNTVLKTRKTHFIPKCLPVSKKPPLYHQL